VNANTGVSILEPVGGSLGRVIPIILAHHERHDGSGYESLKGEEILSGASRKDS